jgi:hypothetical protein
MLEIMRERERLLAQCEMQRADLAIIARQSEGAIKVIDRVIGVANYFRRRPIVLGVAVAALAVIQRRGWWGWVRRTFLLWRSYRAFRMARFTLKV